MSLSIQMWVVAIVRNASGTVPGTPLWEPLMTKRFRITPFICHEDCEPLAATAPFTRPEAK
jgi:hypothetical protein